MCRCCLVLCFSVVLPSVVLDCSVLCFFCSDCCDVILVYVLCVCVFVFAIILFGAVIVVVSLCCYIDVRCLCVRLCVLYVC